jgi:glycosyltransferase involved in cell wall biosynthesis
MGYPVKYLFSHAYEWMLPQSVKEKTVFVGYSTGISSMVKDSLNLKNIRLINKVLTKDKPTHVYLHNYHLLNHLIAKACRKNGGKFIYHAHEPYVENKRAHGGFQHYWLYLSEYMEAKLLQQTDTAIVSSKEGLRLFNKAYPWFNGKKMEIPLMYEDLGMTYNEGPLSVRIAFVGPPVPAKGPEILLRIADYATVNQPDWLFTVISREKITDSKFLNRKNLSIHYKDRISDDEFGKIIQNSTAVLTPYKRETQSSVILVSYMYGTPVVSSDIGGLPEFVESGKTGYLVDINAPVEEWVTSIISIERNSPTMRKNCRKLFEERFSGINWHKYLNDLFT